jgi:hypothetical protein
MAAAEASVCSHSRTRATFSGHAAVTHVEALRRRNVGVAGPRVAASCDLTPQQYSSRFSSGPRSARLRSSFRSVDGSGKREYESFVRSHPPSDGPAADASRICYAWRVRRCSHRPPCDIVAREAANRPHVQGSARCPATNAVHDLAPRFVRDASCPGTPDRSERLCRAREPATITGRWGPSARATWPHSPESPHTRN